MLHPRPLPAAAWLRPALRLERPAAPPDEPLLAAADRAALQGNPWFGALPLLVRHDLLRRCSVRRYRDGETVHPAGSPCQRLDAVVAGAVAIGMRQGLPSTLQYLPPGSWLVDPAMFGGGERKHLVVAGAKTTIVSIGAPELGDAMRVHPGLELALLRLSHDLVTAQCEILDELSILSLRVRLARCLLRLCERFGEADPRGTRIGLDLRQDALAVLVRASRARVNLHLKEMERSGALLVERQIVVLRPALLAAAGGW